jgi:hypothetical protein
MHELRENVRHSDNLFIFHIFCLREFEQIETQSCRGDFEEQEENS